MPNNIVWLFPGHVKQYDWNFLQSQCKRVIICQFLAFVDSEVVVSSPTLTSTPLLVGGGGWGLGGVNCISLHFLDILENMSNQSAHLWLCKVIPSYKGSSWICFLLTHWGRMTHICIIELTIIGSNNGLMPGQRQVIIWTYAGILLIRNLGTNFS